MLNLDYYHFMKNIFKNYLPTILKNKILIIGIVFTFEIFFSVNSFSQDNRVANLKSRYTIPTLTKEQMYQDFDIFVDIIKNLNPQYPLYLNVNQYDMINQILSYRDDIDNCDSTLQFINIMKYCFRSVIDEHCFLGVNVWYFKNSFYSEIDSILGLSDKDYGILFNYRDKVFYNNPRYLYLYVMGNDYYLKYQSKFILNDTVFEFPVGTKILNINGSSPALYINSFKNPSSRYDIQKKGFFNNIVLFDTDSIKLALELDQKQTEFSFNKTILIEKEINNIPTSKYFEEDSVLFISLPIMQYDSITLKNEILQHSKEVIKSVVIDIRGNYGGNDETWISILSLLSNNPFYFKSSLALRDQPTIRERYPMATDSITFPLLGREFNFLILENIIDTIFPNKENLNYNGNIYLLVDQDIFSSAGSFSSLNKSNSRIITIGTPTGRYVGRGINPDVFILPNSRLIFTLELALDFSNIMEGKDFFHDNVDIQVSPSINYVKYYYNPNKNPKIDENEMYQNDDFFRKAIDVIRSE